MADDVTALQSADMDIDAMTDDQVKAQLDEIRKGQPAPSEEQEKPKPAPAATDDDDDDDEEPAPEGQQTVPHGKFHRVNERRKAAEAEAAKERGRADLALQRMAELMQSRQQAEQVQRQQEPEPDPNEWNGDPNDYIGKLEWLESRLKSVTTETAAERKQREEAVKREQYVNTVVDAVSNRWQKAIEARPELDAADSALQKSWREEFAALGWTGKQLDQKVWNYGIEQVLYCYQRQIPIEQHIEKLAMARGWRPGQTAAATDDGKPIERDAQGRFAKAAEEMDKLNATKQAAKSLGGGGGAVKTGDPTPEDLVNMSDEEFRAFKQKFDKQYGEGGAMKKAFGQVA